MARPRSLCRKRSRRHVSVRADVQAVVVTDDSGQLEPSSVVAPGAAAVQSEHTGSDRHLRAGGSLVPCARIDDPGPPASIPSRAVCQTRAAHPASRISPSTGVERPGLRFRGTELVNPRRDVRPMKTAVGLAPHGARRPEPASGERNDRPFDRVDPASS